MAIRYNVIGKGARSKGRRATKAAALKLARGLMRTGASRLCIIREERVGKRLLQQQVTCLKKR